MKARTTQNTITDSYQCFSGVTPYDKSSMRHKEITNSLTYNLARDMMPICTVSKKETQKVIRILDKQHQLPLGKYFFQVAIPFLYNKCCFEVQVEMTTIKFFF